MATGQEEFKFPDEKAEEKKVCLLSSEVVAVQIYEKSAMGAGAKRPGFSIDG